jgi:hypothetical protein
VRLTSPWLSGLVMAVGMGAALGARWRRGPDGQITVGSQAAAGRLFTAVGALLAMDLLGMWGLPALLAAGLVSHVATRRYDVTPPLGRRLAMQEVVLATVTLVAAVRVVWLPWAFESDPVPLFPGRIEAAIEVGWLGQVAAVPLLLGIGVEGTRRGWRLPVVLAVGLVALVLLMLTGL